MTAILNRGYFADVLGSIDRFVLGLVPKSIPSSVFEIGSDRILVRESKGLWYDSVITRVFELEDIENIEVVLDAKSEISWNSDMGMYTMGAPQSNYQVVAKSAADNPDAKNHHRWGGLNLLGFALMEVREILTNG